jgi:hypothetical protein
MQIAYDDNKVGEQVLIYTPDPNKMEQPQEGPYPRITQVHTNGTVTLQKGNVTQRYNICLSDCPLLGMTVN